MANAIIKGMGFAHMAVGAADFDKSMAFYKALGLTVYAQWGEGDSRIALLDMGDGSKLELFAKPGMPVSEDGPWLHFAFAVQNVEEAYEIALKAGAKPYKPPVEMELNAQPNKMTLRVAFVKGPNGEELEFFKQIVNRFGNGF